MKRGGGHAWAMLIVLDWCRSFCYKETIKGLIIVSALKAVGIFKKKKKGKWKPVVMVGWKLYFYWLISEINQTACR